MGLCARSRSRQEQRDLVIEHEHVEQLRRAFNSAVAGMEAELGRVREEMRGRDQEVERLQESLGLAMAQINELKERSRVTVCHRRLRGLPLSPPLPRSPASLVAGVVDRGGSARHSTSPPPPLQTPKTGQGLEATLRVGAQGERRRQEAFCLVRSSPHSMRSELWSHVQSAL